jgi:hypothetical protein
VSEWCVNFANVSQLPSPIKNKQTKDLISESTKIIKNKNNFEKHGGETLIEKKKVWHKK